MEEKLYRMWMQAEEVRCELSDKCHMPDPPADIRIAHEYAKIASDSLLSVRYHLLQAQVRREQKG